MAVRLHHFLDLDFVCRPVCKAAHDIQTTTGQLPSLDDWDGHMAGVAPCGCQYHYYHQRVPSGEFRRIHPNDILTYRVCLRHRSRCVTCHEEVYPDNQCRCEWDKALRLIRRAERRLGDGASPEQIEAMAIDLAFFDVNSIDHVKKVMAERGESISHR